MSGSGLRRLLAEEFLVHRLGETAVGKPAGGAGLVTTAAVGDAVDDGQKRPSNGHSDEYPKVPIEVAPPAALGRGEWAGGPDEAEELLGVHMDLLESWVVGELERHEYRS